MIPSFEFKLQTQVRFGIGSISRLPESLNTFGCRSLGLVVDAGLMNNPAFVDARREVCFQFDIIYELLNKVSEADYDYLEECRADLSGKQVDFLVCFGGGSTIDLAKALSVLVTNPGPAKQYRGFDLIKNPGIPLIAVPSTAGTGSEVTPNAVFTDKQEKRRLGINSSVYLPKITFLDPRMTASCPRSVTVSSGIDALMQAIESYLSIQATPASKLFSKAAFGLVFNSLSSVIRDPNNLALRAQMQLGAFYSGIGLMNSSTGPAGALSYPLGVHFGVPHGLAHAVFEPAIARWNVSKACFVYADLHDAIDGADLAADRSVKSMRFCEMLSGLYKDIEVPQTLIPFGVTKSELPFMIEQAILLKHAIDLNPVHLGPVEIETILAGLV